MTIDSEAVPNLWNDSRMIFMKVVELEHMNWPVGFVNTDGIRILALGDEGRINATNDRHLPHAREFGHKGKWSADGVYAIGDTVFHGGVLFVLTDVATKHAPTERCCQWVPVLIWNMPVLCKDLQWSPGPVEECCIWSPVSDGVGLEKVAKRWPLAFERYEVVRIQRQLFMCMRETCLVHHAVPSMRHAAEWMFLRKTSFLVELYLGFSEPDSMEDPARLLMMAFITESLISDIHMAVLNTIDINHVDGSELELRRMDHFADIY